MEAIQPSWDHEGMIMQEYGGIEAILKDFALTLQSVQNFTPSPHLSILNMLFRTDFHTRHEISHQHLDLV